MNPALIGALKKKSQGSTAGFKSPMAAGPQAPSAPGMSRPSATPDNMDSFGASGPPSTQKVSGGEDAGTGSPGVDHHAGLMSHLNRMQKAPTLRSAKVHIKLAKFHAGNLGKYE